MENFKAAPLLGDGEDELLWIAAEPFTLKHFKYAIPHCLVISYKTFVLALRLKRSSVSKTLLYCLMKGLFSENVPKWMCGKAVVAYYKIICRYLFGGSEEGP